MSYTLSHGQLFNLAKSSWRMGFSPSSIPTRQLGSGGHCHPEHGTKTLPNSTKTRDHKKIMSKLVEQNQFLQLAAMLEARWLAWQVSNSFHLHLLWLSCCFLCRHQGDLCWTESSIERLIYLDQTCQVRFQTTSFVVCMGWHTSAPWQQQHCRWCRASVMDCTSRKLRSTASLW